MSGTAKQLWRRPRRRDIGLRALLGLLSIAFLVLGVSAIVLGFAFLDPVAVGWQRTLAEWFVLPFRYLTHLGLGGVILWPTGIAFLLLLLLARFDLGQAARATLAALQVRIALVFLAVGIPGLAVAIVKRLIGRVRPPAFDQKGHLAFEPIAWSSNAAGFPSGHATTAFAAAVVLGVLWPRARLPLFMLAALIALSRVILNSHYASDAIGGALVGTFGALLVVRAFAARGLAIATTPDGLRAMPGPSWRRLGTLAGAISAALRAGGSRPHKRAADKGA
jgi:undecaprenyl-diphosphatase